MKFFVARNFCGQSKPATFRRPGRSLLTYLIVGVIIGGRLGYVLFYNLEYYALNHSLFFEFGMGEWLFMEDILCYIRGNLFLLGKQPVALVDS